MLQGITDSVLKGIFQLKGNFTPGIRPAARVFEDVEITPFRGAAQASATISADFEMEWAFRGLSLDEQRLMGVRTRENMPVLLRTLNREAVPITWATVGHLFLESCERGTCGRAHPHMPRPPWNPHWQGDWYMHDPCTDVETHPGFYAPDLIGQILSSAVKHEMGTHSFSHIDFSEATSDRELVRGELRACAEVMRPLGLRPRSLVYPRNMMGHHHLDLLADANVTSVRHRDRRVALSYPERTPTGVYKLYESMNLRTGRGYDYLAKAKIFLAEAMKCGAAYHFWFHPSDPASWLENEFQAILQHMTALRDAGRLWIVTMGDLTAYCEAREQTALAVERTPRGVRIRVSTTYDSARYGNTHLTLRVPLPRRPKAGVFRSQNKSQDVEWRTKGVERGHENELLVDIPAIAGELEFFT